MNDFESQNESEKRMIALEAMSYYQGIQLYVLTQATSDLIQKAGISIEGGNTLLNAVESESRHLMRNKLAAIADHDPDRAAKLSSFFELMQRPKQD